MLRKVRQITQTCDKNCTAESEAMEPAIKQQSQNRDQKFPPTHSPFLRPDTKTSQQTFRMINQGMIFLHEPSIESLTKYF